MSKKVFKYKDGTYYAWRGEDTPFRVFHKTKLIAEAADLSGFLREKDALDGIPKYDGGKLVEVLTHDEALEQLAAMTAAKNRAVEALKEARNELRLWSGSALEQASFLDKTISELEK
jgi:hypothetical protein